jgi:hypothetical protein
MPHFAYDEKGTEICHVVHVAMPSILFYAYRDAKENEV